MCVKSLFIFLVLCLALCAQASDLEDLQQTWSDTVITTKIKTAFAQNPHLNPLKISVKTHNGVVVLRGHAKNNAAFVAALRIVANTNDVRAINTSQFEIKSVNSSFKDAYITAQIEAAVLEAKVFEDESIPLVGIKATTANGVVTLSGAVKSEHSITVLLKRIHHIQGVARIKSQLKIEETETA